jgi:PAS domain S-box-containing protein
VEDIAQDRRWDGLRDLALEYGLRACWSEPVLSADGDVVGTFAMYYTHPRAPTEGELRAIEIGAHLAGVAIERKQADEALRESERTLSTLISNLPGMAYRCRNDADWTMQFVSEGSVELTGYRPDQLVGSRDIAYAQLIHPADRKGVREDVQAALDERRHFEITYRLMTPRGEKWVWERGQGVYPNGDMPAAVEGFVTDITERVTARRNLEQRVAERTRELATLLEISHNVASTLELEPLLGRILDHLRDVVSYAAASIMILDQGALKIVAYRGPIPDQEALELSFPVDEAGANRAVIQRREPLIVDDIRGGEPLARAIRETAGEELDTTYGYIRAWMGVPLVVKDRVVGMLSLDHSQPGYYTAGHAQLAMAFANQVAVAIDNARLYRAEQERLEESERRRQVAEGLRDVLTVLNTDRPLTEVLNTIAEQACYLLQAQAGVVYQLSLDQALIEIEASCGMPEEFLDIGSLPLIESEPNLATLKRQPFAASNIQARLRNPPTEEALMDPSVRSWATVIGAHFRSYLSIPIVVRDEVYGAIVVYYDRRRDFSDEEVDLAMTLADQAALAVENARLRDEVQRAAVAAERNRLARDLHDAVTQTLFSASLIADVLPRIWEANPHEGRRRLDELRELTRGALAEMRTLLLELRPAALVDAELSELLRQLAESITGRARVPVSLEVEGSCRLPNEVKVALYRIAQESLNNVAKHAGATQAAVRLECQPGYVDLCIRDDGSGFDLESLPPESLGLGIMRERAEAIGAALTIDSAVGRGTEIEVAWQQKR